MQLLLFTLGSTIVDGKISTSKLCATLRIDMMNSDNLCAIRLCDVRQLLMCHTVLCAINFKCEHIWLQFYVLGTSYSPETRKKLEVMLDLFSMVNKV